MKISLQMYKMSNVVGKILDTEIGVQDRCHGIAGQCFFQHRCPMAALRLIQLLAHVPLKDAEDGWNTRAFALKVGDLERAPRPYPGFATIWK